MIIGISGKKQSGKDTVGKIIQYLTDPNITKEFNWSFDKWYASNLYSAYQAIGTWKKKAFADKLKDIVCLLLGCTREQLEDNTFKETLLGEEWTKWKVTRLNLIIPPTIRYYSTKEEAMTEENRLGMFGSVEKIRLTPRLLLQLLGTECGRQIIHPNIWVNALMSEYKPTVNREFNMASSESDMPDWIITDVRFPNELKSIEDRGGVVIRVNRHDLIYTTEDRHESETALDNHEFSCFTISNDGTIEDLISKVRLILETIKIL